MSELIERLERWHKGKKAPPQVIQLHLTNKCNLNCGFCPTVALKKEENLDYSKELSKKKWEKIIQEANEMGVKEWHICGGGEPLFDKKKSLDLMEKMKSNGARGEIITNGTLVDEEVSRKLVEIDWDLITFSIDGPSKRVNDDIRSEGSFKKAVQNARYLSLLRDKTNTDMILRIHTVICRENYDKIAEMVFLTYKLGFDEIRFNSLNIWSEEGEKQKISEELLENVKKELEKAQNTSRKLDVNTNISEFKEHDILENANNIDKAMKEETKDKNRNNGFKNLSCYYPWFNISIFSDGRVSPCFLFHDGDSIKNKSLKEVWEGDFFEKVREKFLDNNLKEVCKNCNAWNIDKMEEIRNKLHD